MSDLTIMADNVDDVGRRLAQIGDLLHCVAESNPELSSSLYGLANLADSAHQINGKTAAMINRMTSNARKLQGVAS